MSVERGAFPEADPLPKSDEESESFEIINKVRNAASQLRALVRGEGNSKDPERAEELLALLSYDNKSEGYQRVLTFIENDTDVNASWEERNEIYDLIFKIENGAVKKVYAEKGTKLDN